MAPSNWQDPEAARIKLSQKPSTNRSTKDISDFSNIRAVKMVKKELKVKCSLKAFSRAFWARGVHFRPLYEKPDLSCQDIKDRLAWAEAHANRSPAQCGRLGWQSKDMVG